MEDFEITQAQAPLCFGVRDITEPRALAICDALYLRENVKARELADSWLRAQPAHPGAQFALAEVLFSVEANLPRALFHLKQAESLTNYSSLGRALASGYLEWHYLTLSQLSYVHQLMGDQIAALEYLGKLESILATAGYGGPILVMQGYGGLLPASEAAERAVGMIECGPAAGVIGSKFLGDLIGDQNIIAADMGGTTFKVGVIQDGELEYAREPLIDRFHYVSPDIS